MRFAPATRFQVRHPANPLPGHARALAIAAAAILGAVGIGGVVALAPLLGLGLAIAALAGIVLLLMPVAYLPAVVLAAATAMPLILLQARATGTDLSGTPLAGQASALLAIGAAGAFRLAFGRNRVRPPTYAVGAMALLLVGVMLTVVVASVRDNIHPDWLQECKRQVSLLVAFPLGFAAGLVAARKAGTHRALGLVALAACMASLAFWAIVARGVEVPGPVQTLFQDVHNASRYGKRSVLPFTDDSPNLNAVAMVAAVVATVPALTAAHSRFDRGLGIVLVAVLPTAVLTTQSRTGIIVMAAAVVPYFLLNSKRRRRTIVLAVLATGSFVYGMYQYLPEERVISARADTFVARRGIWAQGVEDFKDAPLLGNGYNYSAQGRFIEVLPGRVAPMEQSIHSDYLGNLIDGGVIGAGLFAAPFVAFLVTGLRLSRLTGFARQTGIATVCLFAVLTTSMLVGATMESAAVSIIAWLYFGIAVGVYTDADRSRVHG